MNKIFKEPKDKMIVIVNVLLCALLAFGMFVLKDIELIYGEVYLEQILINITQNVDGVDYAIVFTMLVAFMKNFVIVALPYVIISVVLALMIKSVALYKKQLLFTVVGIVGVLVLSYMVNEKYKVIAYITRADAPTEIFEQYYVDPETATYHFPDEDRNLIYIFSESLETSILSCDVGGYEEKSLLPNLEAMAKDNVVLSNGNGMQGGEPIYGTTWTAAGIVAQTSGVPLKSAIGGDNYGKDGMFTPGVYSIGELLASRGYNNYFRMGSEATYSNRNVYLETNGDYEIYDLVYMKETGVYPPDYKVGWGYEDYDLFEFAKEDLIRIAQSDEPFNYMMLTVDTHFPDGHTCDHCPTDDERQYANVYKCQDQLISDFILWAQQQDFYENTTIVVAGDHISMDRKFFLTYPERAVRTPFNMIVNSVKELETTTGRYFTSMDMYPTTLAAMGIEVEGDRLGLGTNLFGTRITVLEELGFEALANDLSGYSVFYNDKILNDPNIEYVQD